MIDEEKIVYACLTCEGTGEVDSGGFTPWESPIRVTCGACNGAGEMVQLTLAEHDILQRTIATLEQEVARLQGLVGWEPVEVDGLLAVGKYNGYFMNYKPAPQGSVLMRRVEGQDQWEDIPDWEYDLWTTIDGLPENMRLQRRVVGESEVE